MRYIIESDKPVEQLVEDLQESVKANNFGVLNIHNLQETLKKKGFDLAHACYILDVCNPKQAVNVLNEDMGMNVALPCRISVYEENGKTKLGMIRPKDMLAALSDSPTLAQVADEVEETLIHILDQAK